MSQPASDPNEPVQTTPGGTPPPPPPEEFDLLAFWIQNRKLIIRLLVLALLAVVIYGAYEVMQYRKRVDSQEALAKAETADSLRKVIEEWRGTAAAGIAHLQLAEKLREENKPEEAARTIGHFLNDYPLHPLRTTALYTQAASLETAGKLDEALDAYKRMAADHGTSAFAPLAMIGQARVLIAKGSSEDAGRILETVQEKFQNSTFFGEAGIWLDQIKNPAGWKTGGTPRPAPAPAPAPPKPGLPPSPPAQPAPPGGTPPPAAPQPAPPANVPSPSLVPNPVQPPAPTPSGGTSQPPAAPATPAPATPPTPPVAPAPDAKTPPASAPK